MRKQSRIFSTFFSNLDGKIASKNNYLINNYKVILKILGLIILPLTFFNQDLQITFSDALINDVNSYVLFIPLIISYVIYRKRQILKITSNLPKKSTISFLSFDESIGLCLLFICILVYFITSYSFSPLTNHLLIFPIFVSSFILLFFNWQTLRELIFPIFLLFLLVPLPSELIYNIGSTLSEISSLASFYILNILGYPVEFVYEYGTPTILLILQNGVITPFTVDIACSGIYSQIGFLVFALFLSYIIRNKFLKKISILLIGFFIIYTLNILRILFIILIGYYSGVSLALDLFHTLGGWFLIFVGTILLLIISEKILNLNIINQSKKPTSKNYCSIQSLSNHLDLKRDIFKIIGLSILTILILNIQAPVFALTKGPVDIELNTPQGSEITTSVLPEIDDYYLEFLFRDYNFEALAKEEAALMYVYYPLIATEKTIWVSIEIASSTSSLHGWTYCLLTSPLNQGNKPNVDQILLDDVEILSNPPIIGRYFLFKDLDNDRSQAVLYWYETATVIINNQTEQRKIKISIITYPNNNEIDGQTENQLMYFAKNIANYWEPVRAWSNITLLTSKIGEYLLIFPIALLIGILSCNKIKKHRKKMKNAVLYKKFSKEDQILLFILKNKTRFKTIDEVKNQLKLKSKFKMLENEINNRIQRLKNLGFIEEKIINNNDEPCFVYKAII